MWWPLRNHQDRQPSAQDPGLVERAAPGDRATGRGALGWWGAATLGLVGAIATLIVSCTSLNRTVVQPPQIPGAEYVGNQVCADCHAQISRHFPSSPHARIHIDAAQLKGSTGCESCHGPASKHVAAGGGRGKFIVNPGRDPAGCFQCHLANQAEFHLPHHHPVLEQKMNCAQCHDPHGGDIFKPSSGLGMARLNQACASCHREQSKPMVFEHEALREGCVVCHHPHGSVNEKMLVERNANLCLRCHAQIQGPGFAPGRFYIGTKDHTDYVRQGTCWSCHQAVHGSNVNPQMLY